MLRLHWPLLIRGACQPFQPISLGGVNPSGPLIAQASKALLYNKNNVLKTPFSAKIMAWPKKTSYVGVDRDDFETESITGSTHTGASQYDRRSDIMLIKYQAQRHASNVTSGASKRLRRLFSREFWQHTPSRTKAFLQDAFTDLKSLGWRHHAWRFTTIFVPLAVIAGLIVVLPIITAGKLYEVKEACRPDSGFYVGYDHFDIWAPSGFFQITLGFGQLPFSTAKIIDVGWDVGEHLRSSGLD